jgi:DNA-binding beta-propeller fold protein YncE
MGHLLKTGTNILKVGGNIFSVQDTYSYTNVATLPIDSPRGLCFDPVIDRNRFLAIEQSTNRCYIYDATSFAKTGAIANLAFPAIVQFDPVEAHNRLFIGNLGNGGFFTVYDANSLEVISTVTTAHGGSGIAFDPVPANNRILICSNIGLYELDATTFALGRSLTTGFSEIRGVVFDPVAANNRFFVSNGGTGEVFVFNATTFARTGVTGNGISGNICFDPYLPNNRMLCAARDNILSIDATSLGTKEIISGFRNSQSVSVAPSPVSRRLIVSNNDTNTVTVTDRVLN